MIIRDHGNWSSSCQEVLTPMSRSIWRFRAMTSVSDTTVAVRKFLAYESWQTLEYEIFTRTKISAITVFPRLHVYALRSLSNSERNIGKLYKNYTKIFKIMRNKKLLLGRKKKKKKWEDAGKTVAFVLRVQQKTQVTGSLVSRGIWPSSDWK